MCVNMTYIDGSISVSGRHRWQPCDYCDSYFTSESLCDINEDLVAV